MLTGNQQSRRGGSPEDCNGGHLLYVGPEGPGSRLTGLPAQDTLLQNGTAFTSTVRAVKVKIACQGLKVAVVSLHLPFQKRATVAGEFEHEETYHEILERIGRFGTAWGEPTHAHFLRRRDERMLGHAEAW